MTSPTPRPRRSRAEIEAQLSRKEAEGLTYQQLSAQCGIPISTLARWGMWIGRERRQAAAASQWRWLDLPVPEILSGIGAPDTTGTEGFAMESPAAASQVSISQ